MIAAPYRQIGAVDAYVNFKDVTQTPKQPPHSFIHLFIHSPVIQRLQHVSHEHQFRPAH